MDAETTGIKIDRLSNVLPIIIDYWLSEEQYEEFCNYYSSTKCLLITSKEVYTYLLSKNIPIPIKHFPLSIPDDNVSADYLHCPKEFDFLFAGRRDPVFWEYMKLYEKEHPEIEYLYQELEEQKPVYISNKRGKLEGDFFSREGYLNLLRKSRITFYATPGMDKTKNANGFNQVTPRFLELLASGCLVMGRYIENPDTEFYELNKYCPLVETYDDFKSTLNLFFDREWSANHISHYYTYLQKHITSTRTPILKQILSSL
ncbi:glycosyltransferase family 1 protein [Bacteroidales bacterium OttesenSCG-928-A17]|nr:glycosyltransferase family 1 protein [Bacteroidales bacterium OttesenSCG-928-A17]